MARQMLGLKVVAMVIGLLVIAPETMQLFVDHPMYGVVRRINDDSGQHLVLMVSSSRDEKTLMRSGHFQPDSANPKIVVAGRTVHIGKFRGAPSLVVHAEGPLANVAATAQSLMDMFKIRGFIHYGAAGAVGHKVKIGDVVLPDAVAFTGVWQWQEYQASTRSDEEELASLRFGDYNLPKAGENKLAYVEHQRVTLYTPSGANQQAFWIPLNREWHRIASSINGIIMEKCTDGTASSCERIPSELVQGVKAASSDIYVKNEAYANFLHRELGASTIDTTSAAVVATATANGVPSIVFRGAANKPGIEVENEMKNVVSRNLLQTVIAFVEQINTPKPMPRTY